MSNNKIRDFFKVKEVKRSDSKGKAIEISPMQTP